MSVRQPFSPQHHNHSTTFNDTMFVGQFQQYSRLDLCALRLSLLRTRLAVCFFPLLFPRDRSRRTHSVRLCPSDIVDFFSGWLAMTTTPTAVEGAVAELSGSRADTVRVSDQRTAVSPPTLGDRFSRHLLHAFYFFFRSLMMVSIY